MRREVRSVHDLARRITLDLKQDLLLSLDFQDHLHVDVFDVEVFFCYDEGAGVRMQIIQSMISSGSRDSAEVLTSVVQAQAIVVANIRLLQRVNRIWLHVLWIGTFRKAALRILELRIIHMLRVNRRATAAHLRRLLLANVKGLAALLLVLCS